MNKYLAKRIFNRIRNHHRRPAINHIEVGEAVAYFGSVREFNRFINDHFVEGCNMSDSNAPEEIIESLKEARKLLNEKPCKSTMVYDWRYNLVVKTTAIPWSKNKVIELDVKS